MDEHQYRTTYQEINPKRCVFEKAINSRVCNCSKSKRFNLADREGVACISSDCLDRCQKLITMFRTNSKFVIKELDSTKALGHAQESKIQNGGLLGLQAQLNEVKNDVEDINTLIDSAVMKYDALESFPYSEIIKVIATYNIRKRQRR